jgi:bacillithiol biosynthesis deacetylase BshB1
LTANGSSVKIVAIWRGTFVLWRESLMTLKADILAFSPHPDDVELGCGGSLILASESGLRVVVADLTAGEMSSRGAPAQRAREAKAAAEQLKLSARLSLELPDTDIGTDSAHRQAIIRLLREVRPRLVLAPYQDDRHPDHRAAGALIRDACFYAGVSKMGKGAPHRPRHLFYYMIHSPFTPSFVVDVSTVWERRMAAVRAYRSQFQAESAGPETALSRPDFLRFVEARAVWFGAMIGVAYGEPFLSQGPVPTRELPGISDPDLSAGGLPAYHVFG